MTHCYGLDLWTNLLPECSLTQALLIMCFHASVDSHNLESADAIASVHCAGNPEVISVSGVIHGSVTLKGIKSDLTLFHICLLSGLDVYRWHMAATGYTTYIPRWPLCLSEEGNEDALLVVWATLKFPPPPFPTKVMFLELVEYRSDCKRMEEMRACEIIFGVCDTTLAHQNCSKTFKISFLPFLVCLKEQATVQQVKEWLDRRFIQLSNAMYGTRVSFVHKKDGGLRVAITEDWMLSPRQISILCRELIIDLISCAVSCGCTD